MLPINDHVFLGSKIKGGGVTILEVEEAAAVALAAAVLDDDGGVMGVDMGDELALAAPPLD